MPAPRRTVLVQSQSGEVRVTYRPNDITVQDYGDAERDPHGAAIRLIASCVCGWNIGGWSDGRWPITVAAIGHLPEALFLDIAKAIVIDYRRLLVAEQERMSA